MPDVYTTINELDTEAQERIAAVLELRAADPDQRAMLERYVAELELPPGARVLEVGCGVGSVCRFLAGVPNVGSVLGVDPCRLFVERARALTDGARVEFATGDAHQLDLEDGSFDAVVFHTTLCHVAEPERVLAEAHRVLRPDGVLVVFDGDYVTPTVALGAHDPLQACVEAAVAELVHDPWFVRGLARLVRGAGFDEPHVMGHAYTKIGHAPYMLALVERGADALAAVGSVGPGAAEALKAEARRRMDEGTFFGHIGYVSLIARRR